MEISAAVVVLRMLLLAMVVTAAVTSDAPVAPIPDWYNELRNNFINEEKAMRLGKNLILDAREEAVNRLLMEHKTAAVEASRTTDALFPPAVHFFRSKQLIDDSQIFKIIKKMPKGGVLHLHSSAMTSLLWMIKNLTYRDESYTRIDNATGVRYFGYFTSPPENGWTNIQVERHAHPNVDEYDEMLARDLSIYVKNPYKEYPSTNDVWPIFQAYFSAKDGLFGTPEDERSYLYQGMKEFLEDGVQYMEIKEGMSSNPESNDAFVDMFQEVVAELQGIYPQFIGAKIVANGYRMDTRKKELTRIKEAMRLMDRNPGWIVGFDLVSQEDINNLTVAYINSMLYPRRQGERMPYFFHAGETDWTNSVDLNLVDSILLNASRIGHGFAVVRHPKVLQAVIEKDIAIELAPISNQVLGLVSDLRNHPGAQLISMSAPVVVCSDDPPLWMATPLSHDFYMAFMGLGAVDDDLRLLKQLAMNSIKYSAMTEQEKQDALGKWFIQWTLFIDDIVDTYNLQV